MSNLRAAPIEIKWHSDLPIYASEDFLKAVGDEYGWLGGIDDSGRLRCVLPYSLIRKPAFRMIRFRVETIPLDGELQIRDEKTFLESALGHFRSIGADLIVPASNNAIFRTYPDGAVAAPYGTFLKELDRPEDVLLSEISADYRKNIRRATTHGVQIKSGKEYLDASYQLIADTLKRSSQKFRSYHEFRRDIVVGLGDNVKLFVAEYKGQLQACMVSPFSKHSAYSWYSGTIAEPEKGAMHLLQWEAIRQFHAMGVRRFNFTGVRINPEKGSRQEGIMSFKMRFGGRLVQGYMWKYALHRLKFAAYSVAVRFLKGGDIVDNEGHKLAVKDTPSCADTSSPSC